MFDLYDDFQRVGYPDSIAFVTDTSDDNSRLRLLTRTQVLFGGAQHCQVVHADTGFEVGLQAIDCIDALMGGRGIMVLNKASRNQTKYKNGDPYGIAWAGNTLVVGTLAGQNFSLLREFGLIEGAYEINVPLFVEKLQDSANGFGMDPSVAEGLLTTQFRTYELAPFAALMEWLWKGSVPVYDAPTSLVEEVRSAVCLVDRFGNCKTNITEKRLLGKSSLVINDTTFPVYTRMKDVPVGQAAVIVGSSGLHGQRFCEIIVQGGSASSQFNLHSSTLLTIE